MVFQPISVPKRCYRTGRGGIAIVPGVIAARFNTTTGVLLLFKVSVEWQKTGFRLGISKFALISDHYHPWMDSHHGQYFTVENARIYSLPPEPPSLHVAAAGPESTQLSIDHGDGLIGTEADNEGDAEVSGRGLRPCLRSLGGPEPGGVHGFLRARDSAEDRLATLNDYAVTRSLRLAP